MFLSDMDGGLWCTILRIGPDNGYENDCIYSNRAVSPMLFRSGRIAARILYIHNSVQ